MTHTATARNSDATGVRQSYAGPIWTLLILAPFIAEVLSGATRLSYLFVLVPEVMLWGVGALLCRDLVRRWRGGVASLLLLGLGLSIAEEFLIQQTSLAPLPWPGANAGFGRLYGVNWVYFLFMLGFESVWVVLIPVQVTELFFPNRRNEAWLGKKARIALPVVFVLGSFMAWYGWTQQALPRMHVAPYHPPVLTRVLGALAMVLLGCAAYAARKVGRDVRSEGMWTFPAWAGFLLALVFSAGWWSIMTVLFQKQPWASAGAVLAGGCAWAVAACIVLFRGSWSAGWSDQHRWAVAFGATLATMAVPYLSPQGWLKPDLIAKIAFDALALVGFLMLANRVRTRARV